MTQFELTSKDIRTIYGLLLLQQIKLSSFKFNNEEDNQYRLSEIKRLKKIREKFEYYLNKK